MLVCVTCARRPIVVWRCARCRCMASALRRRRSCMLTPCCSEYCLTVAGVPFHSGCGSFGRILSMLSRFRAAFVFLAPNVPGGTAGGTFSAVNPSNSCSLYLCHAAVLR